jgi:hypothetical protein
MRRAVRWMTVLTVAAGALASAQTAMAQSDDDWEFSQDATRSIAMATYAGGQSIIVQCAGPELKLVLVGLPATTETSRRLEAVRADGATDSQTWQVVNGEAMVSGQPARDVRFLRVGGVMRLQSPAGQAAPVSAAFDLPTRHANLDRVLTACGYPLEEARDAIPRVSADVRMAEPPRRGTQGGQPGKSLEISCIVESGAYRRCQADHVVEGVWSRTGRRTANTYNGIRLNPEDAAANEGRVVYIFLPLGRPG